MVLFLPFLLLFVEIGTQILIHILNKEVAHFIDCMCTGLLNGVVKYLKYIIVYITRFL